MSGSLTYRTYTSDDGKDYSVKIDKSNAQGLATQSGGVGTSTTELCPVRTANHPPLPKSVKMRYVNCYNPNAPLQKKRLYVGDVSQMSRLAATGGAVILVETLSNGAAGASVIWVVESYRGEAGRVVPPFSAPDSGLNDGTVGQ
jgi:hypothetical protein